MQPTPKNKNIIGRIQLPDLKKVADEKKTAANSGEGSSILPNYLYENKWGPEAKASDPHIKVVATVLAAALTMVKAKSEAEAQAEQRRLLEEKMKNMARFGPIYGEDTVPNRLAKDSAWKHMIDQSTAELGIVDPKIGYMKSMNNIQKEAAACYGNYIEQKQARGVEFRTLMARDSCFFLQLALHILGGKDILGYNINHPYLAKGSYPTSLIPDMFFVGNQIPTIVIQASMEQPFFQDVIKRGKWKRPDHDLEKEKLALYLIVVEPHVEEKRTLNNSLPQGLVNYLPFIKLPPPNFRDDDEPPTDVLHALHCLLLGSKPHKDANYADMKEFRDLEAGTDGKELKIHSAGELKKQGIKLVKGELGITNIRFKNMGYSAYLYVPPFIVNAHTEHLLASLAQHELTLKESQREVTAYFRFMRDLACNYKDFRILEKKGIIIVEDKKLKSNMVYMLDTIVSSHNSNYTLNFRQIRRRIEDYGGPPWRLISVCLGLLAVVQTIFTVLSYVIPR